MRYPFDVPVGLNGDDTTFGAQGRWAACSLIRWRNGRPQVDGGWESLIATQLTGVCRTVFPWTDNSAVLNIGFGTNSAVQAWQGGALYDITPFGPPTPLSANPFTTANGTATVTVAHVAHGYTTGLSLKIFGAATTAGILAANLNGTRTITVTGVDAYTFTAGSNATSTATGGGSAIVVTPQTPLAAGAIDGTGQAGYSTGGFGVGGYSLPSTADYFPRTWSFAAWGQQLMMSPRNGGLYLWANNTASRAVAVNSAPTQISHMVVAPIDGGYMVFALGCNQEADGVFNPMAIRHSAIRAETLWSTATSTSREYVLTGGGRIVAGRMCGPYLLVWTNDALWLGAYTGALVQPWKFTRVGRNCGLAGPNAAVIVGQSAYWVSPDRQFYSYDLGGNPAPIPCPIRTEFSTNLAAAQADKIVASSTAEYSEVKFDYPDARDGVENSRFVRMCLTEMDPATQGPAWSQGQLARTAYVDAQPSLYPIGTTYAGNIYYHERGHSADGSDRSWFLESAAQLIDVDWRLLVKSFWPDFENQVGPITVTIKSREHPQGDITTYTATPMSPGDAKADVLISGRIFQIRLEGNSTPTDMRLGRPVIEAVQAGQTP